MVERESNALDVKGENTAVVIGVQKLEIIYHFCKKESILEMKKWENANIVRKSKP